MANTQKFGALLKQKIGELLSPTPPAAVLSEQVATPTVVYPAETPTGDVRRAIDSSIPDMSTPLATLSRLKRAKGGDTRALVEAVEPIIQMDLCYSAAVDTMIEALTSATLISQPSGPLARDKKISDDVQRMLLDNEAVMGIVEHLASVDDFGYAAAEVIWNTSGTKWTVDNILPVNPAWILFDKNDARTPRLAPAVSGQPAQPLATGKFIYVALPGYGLPYLRSHGYAAAFLKSLANMTVKDWAGYLEQHGQPMRKGTYDPAAIADPKELEKAKKVLKAALQNIASDAWAMLPKGLEIELLESATKSSSSDLYERFTRYVDEMITKRKTGSVLATGTGNTGSGGTQALGTVHSDATMRKVRGLGKRVASAIRKGVVEPFVRFNYGEDAPVPFVTFSFEEQEDIGALSQALGVLVPLGLQVAQEEVRDRLGLRAPGTDEEVLGAPALAPAPAPAVEPGKPTAAMSAQFSANADPASGLDELDALGAELLDGEEYTLADADADEALLSAIESMAGGNGTALKAALVAAIRTGDVSSMQAVFAAGTTAARLAGDMGAEIGMGG